MSELNLITLIGLTAAFCTTISFLPQAVRVIKSRQTRDISLGMYILFSSGVFLWLVYGIVIRDLPIIIANAVTFAFSFTILIFKLKYKE